MSAEFEYIELIFENCNSVKIYPEYIVNMSCIDITEHLIINYIGQVVYIKTCRDFMIELKEEALNLETEFQKKHNIKEETFENYVKEFRNLTHISVKNPDEKYNIAVPWKFEGGGVNKKQKYISLGNTFRIYCGEIDE